MKKVSSITVVQLRGVGGDKQHRSKYCSNPGKEISNKWYVYDNIHSLCGEMQVHVDLPQCDLIAVY